MKTAFYLYVDGQFEMKFRSLATVYQYINWNNIESYEILEK